MLGCKICCACWGPGGLTNLGPPGTICCCCWGTVCWTMVAFGGSFAGGSSSFLPLPPLVGTSVFAMFSSKSNPMMLARGFSGSGFWIGVAGRWPVACLKILGVITSRGW
uniref:(northern house mosquito) hypothetical protein n=1 Tax=Culex pipiens TaxID=7175 RepID=A0A8D8KCU5_CULPI